MITAILIIAGITAVTVAGYFLFFHERTIELETIKVTNEILNTPKTALDTITQPVTDIV